MIVTPTPEDKRQAKRSETVFNNHFKVFDFDSE